MIQPKVSTHIPLHCNFYALLLFFEHMVSTLFFHKTVMYTQKYRFFHWLLLLLSLYLLIICSYFFLSQVIALFSINFLKLFYTLILHPWVSLKSRKKFYKKNNLTSSRLEYLYLTQIDFIKEVINNEKIQAFFLIWDNGGIYGIL